MMHRFHDRSLLLVQQNTAFNNIRVASVLHAQVHTPRSIAYQFVYYARRIVRWRLWTDSRPREHSAYILIFICTTKHCATASMFRARDAAANHCIAIRQWHSLCTRDYKSSGTENWKIGLCTFAVPKSRQGFNYNVPLPGFYAIDALALQILLTKYLSVIHTCNTLARMPARLCFCYRPIDTSTHLQHCP